MGFNFMIVYFFIGIIKIKPGVGSHQHFFVFIRIQYYVFYPFKASLIKNRLPLNSSEKLKFSTLSLFLQNLMSWAEVSEFLFFSGYLYNGGNYLKL